MNQLYIIYIFVLTISLFGCNNQIDKPNNVNNKLEIDSITNKNEKVFNKIQFIDCNSVNDKKVIFEISKSILENKENNNIWNLHEIDTSDVFSIEDYFTNNTTKNKLILISGSAGLSAGSADNLLILLSCTDTLNIIWSEQIGEIDKAKILDFNGDGIKELVFTSNMMWMGECNEEYKIINFKNNKRNILFYSHSTSYIDCGFDNYNNRHKKGDTMEVNSIYSINSINKKEYFVKKIREIKIHNGGKSDDELIKKLTVIIDSTNLKIN